MKSNFKDEAFGGILGKTIRVRQVKGKMLMNSQTRKVTDKLSENQLSVQKRFLAASQFAKRQIANPETREVYKAGVSDSKRSAYMVAMSDFLNAPEVLSIETERYDGRIGSKITINAVDDFEVTEVLVRITDADDVLLEEGPATFDPNGAGPWEYIATVMNTSKAGTKIRAVAFDRPGHKGVLEVTL